MPNIKHLFFIMISVNVLLIFFFLSVSLRGAPKDPMTTNQQLHSLFGNDKTSSVDSLNVFESGDKMIKVVNLTREIILDDGLSEPQNEISAGNGTQVVESQTIPKTKKEQFDEFNSKIQSDPKLAELVSNFKKLAQHYQKLNTKYQKLEQDHKKLKNVQESDKTIAPSENNKTLTPATQKKMNEMIERTKQVQLVMRLSNPLFLLGAYPNVSLEYFNSYPDGRPFYERPNYGLHNDPDYCELADMYNLAHPENMFKRKTFFTDYAKNGLARQDVIRKIGYDLSPKVSKYMPKFVFRTRTLHLDPRITNFFTKRVDLHIYHEIGKHFLCATQMYNHIPGHGILKRKDLIVDAVDSYALKFHNRSHCFNKHKFFPFSYRLYVKEECKTFFKEINSAEYREKSKNDPIQYLLKVGFGAHRAQGVFLLDKNQSLSLKRLYNNGKACGVNKRSLIAQTYVTNPLLLDFNNKFDFRVYMLIASTNPLIAYYHDGFLRVSLYPYDKQSNDRSTHLTNTHLSKDIFAEIKQRNTTLNGMNETELRDYQMWSLEDLQEHLLSVGKISDPNWLNNYLKPKFKEAFIHIVRMTSGAFWKQSNVYEMFGLDFMLDSDLNLWFIECNSSPQLIGTNPYKTDFLIKMLKDLFEIQYAYYKSRMARVLRILKDMDEEAAIIGTRDYSKWTDVFAEAWKNRLEPEFNISANNSFEIIMDQNLQGPDAYFGILKDECALE